MRLGDLDALKEALTSETRDKFVFVCLSRVLEKIDNAPTVAVNCKDCDGYEAGYSAGLADAKSDIITLIANEYTSHGELVPNWLTIGDTKVFDRQKKGGAE